MVYLSNDDKARLQRFNHDVKTKESVKKILLDTFLTQHSNGTIHELAAAKIAIDLLETGFKEISRIQITEDNEKERNNPV